MFLNTNAQDLYHCGLDNNTNVNADEARFLNNYLKEKKKGFDFQGKKIAFVTGLAANKIGNKKKYFDLIKEWSVHDRKIPSLFIELTESEKKKSGGYDAIIGYNTIAISEKRKQKIIEML